ncbi:uncharacterized protein LOC133797109 [Humulus lupulus]|uniref:uncharacterized protein LOC133797109 n=1 Tax=Humulus lupulus TaxID=3486 RepID=UPI002B40706E|nr:uncharacterized protein LOC133797109 [Humulus lupulus]XP_062090909.1 uncharacterized protein LOC133797109 [Humulus lupulus]
MTMAQSQGCTIKHSMKLACEKKSVGASVGVGRTKIAGGDMGYRKFQSKYDLGVGVKRVACGVQKLGPFTISIPLQDSSYGPLLEYIFHEDLDADEHIVDTNFHHLDRQLFSTLSPAVMLSGDVTFVY